MAILGIIFLAGIFIAVFGIIGLFARTAIRDLFGRDHIHTMLKDIPDDAPRYRDNQP